MKVTTYAKNGTEKMTARPKGGVTDEFQLVQTILMNLILEKELGEERVMMQIDLEGMNQGVLMEIAQALRRCSNIAT